MGPFGSAFVFGPFVCNGEEALPGSSQRGRFVLAGPAALSSLWASPSSPLQREEELHPGWLPMA